ncbi:MAG: NAD(P)H-dependent oxidoreductase subunit E [Spirochaetales bacterium]|nr:NAD(P)H-dependent oxidoreductase subunit E [Spirochaetales bacterium]
MDTKQDQRIRPDQSSDCALDPSDIIPQLDRIIEEYDGTEGALIPVLQSAQNLLGYLSREVLIHISESLKIPFSEVTGVVSFYSFFSTHPRGKHIVRVCLGTACYVRGGKEVLQSLEKVLGIRVGETTEDRLFSLEVGRCFGACGLAPVVMVDDSVHQRVRPAAVRDILDQYREEVSDAS